MQNLRYTGPSSPRCFKTGYITRLGASELMGSSPNSQKHAQKGHSVGVWASPGWAAPEDHADVRRTAVPDQPSRVAGAVRGTNCRYRVRGEDLLVAGRDWVIGRELISARTLFCWSEQHPRAIPSSVGQHRPAMPRAAHALLSSHAPGSLRCALTKLEALEQQPSETPSDVGQQSPTRPAEAHAELSQHRIAIAPWGRSVEHWQGSPGVNIL